MHTPTPGEIRVTVPIDSASVITAGGYLLDDARLEIAEGVEVVCLQIEEQERLMERDIFTSVRMEFFGLIPEGFSHEPLYFSEPEDPSHSAAREIADGAIARIRHVLSLHALASRQPWRPASVVLDQFDGTVWRRVGYLELPSEWNQRQLRASHFPEDRLDTWRALLSSWKSEPALDLALQYYTESVIERKDRRYERSLVAAAIATEILLGERTELSYRISVRGAHLVGVGAPALAVQRRLKELYEARSKLVHSGRPASAADCELWQQFLMAALPRAAAYAGNVNELRLDLDRASFLRSDKLQALEGGGWWAYCNFAQMVSPSI